VAISLNLARFSGAISGNIAIAIRFFIALLVKRNIEM
jgi:hypothetical protein